jgi:EAL domain-containing protein (putative c-di-GMP-specific phosphodiesterase class I)
VPGLVEDVSRMLRDRHLPTESLCLELTETAIMGDRLRSVGVMRRLRALGVGIAIDDFGQGQSSLAYLSQLPISSAKIDRDFIRTFTAESEVIVRSVVMMGESFGFKVVAEGIETGATADRLVELNCRYGQGYHFARPLPPFEFAAWLDRWILEHAATV